MTGSTTIRITAWGGNRYKPPLKLPELFRYNREEFFNGAGYQDATFIYGSSDG